MLVGSGGERPLHVSPELRLQLVKLLDEQCGVVVVGYVAVLLVLVHALRGVVFVVGLVGIELLAVAEREERGHHADAAQLVLQVDHIYLVAERCQIHASRSAQPVNEPIHALSLLVGEVDGLLEVVLGPCRAAGGVDDQGVGTAVLVAGSLHHPVADFLRAV